MSAQVTPYLRRCIEQNTPKLAFSATDSEEWRTWRRRLRSKLRGLLAPWPRAVPLNPRIGEVVDAGDHWRESILLDTHVNAEMPCYLLRPKVAGPLPVILALHGHGPGKNLVAGLVSADIADASYAYGLQMVRHGYAVFTFDFMPFGERRETEHNAREGYEYACNSTLIRTLLWGYNLLTLNIFDALRAIDYLETRAEVDHHRIGVMGCSYGGTVSLYTAILDRRVRAAVLSCSLGEYRVHGVELDELCGAQVVPGILQWAEMRDIAGLTAPKPLLTESGQQDTCFPWHGTEPTLARLREVYAMAGAQDKLEIKVYDGGHAYYGDSVPAFWARWL